MIADFPHSIRIRKAKLQQPTGQRLSNIRTQQTKISIVPILFLCYEASLVSSNLNSKKLGFHGAHPSTCRTYLAYDKDSYKDG